MAAADKYRWTSGGRQREAWRARWVDAAGVRRDRRGFDRKADALQYARDREAEVRHGLPVDAVSSTAGLTVRQWSEKWLRAQEVRPSSLTSYEYAVRRIVNDLGGRELAGLKASELKEWRRALRDRYARTTADQTASILAMILRAADQDGHRVVRMPAAKGGGAAGRIVDPDELLTREQVELWGKAMPDVCAAMPMVAALTGLRQGELLGLQWHRVDLNRGTLRVDGVDGQLLTPAGAGRPVYGPPKTAAGARTVPMVRRAQEALERHAKVQPPVPGEPVFRGRRFGQRWRRGTFDGVWRQAAADAGLPAWAHWHALRDVYASALIRSGLDLRTVMTLVGHSSSEETLRVYARIWPDAQDRARAALEGLWDL